MADKSTRHQVKASGGIRRGGQQPSAAGGIEREIDTLRQSMIRTYMEDSSFSSERVIEISRKLDLMINEYMRSNLSRTSG